MTKEKIPNQLTMLRIFMIPIFVAVFYWPKITGASTETFWPWMLAALIFALASFTDWLDGHLARKWQVITNFGKFADPLADKILTLVAFVLMVEAGLVPGWAVAIIVTRELAVTGLRLLLVEQGGEVLAAAMPGKIKTATQMIAIILLLIGQQLAGDIFLIVCLFFTVYSGWEYFRGGLWVFKDAGTQKKTQETEEKAPKIVKKRVIHKDKD